MNDSSKENANPIVHAVKKRSTRAKKHKPLGWSQIERLNFVPNDDEHADGRLFKTPQPEWNTLRSAEERAVFLALTDAARSSPKQNFSLLKSAGFPLSYYPKEATPSALRQPAFIPASPTKPSPVRNVSEKRRNKIDAEEIFSIIRNIQDPEHPLTLEQLNVVNLSHVEVYDASCPDDSLPPGQKTPLSFVDVRFTPTIPHCSMATLIGLSIRVKLLQSLPSRFKVKVSIQPGTHASENAVNKQLADKERVSAALENSHLLGVVNKCIMSGMRSEV